MNYIPSKFFFHPWQLAFKVSVNDWCITNRAKARSPTSVKPVNLEYFVHVL